jgi:LPS-assembly lipoprotein
MGIAGSLLLVGGCSYRPLYGTGESGVPVVTSLSSIAIPEAKDRLGQLVRNELLSSIRPAGQAGDDVYVLIIDSKLRKSNAIESSMPGLTRQSAIVNVSYSLRERTGGREVTSGRTFSRVSFDVIREPIADMQAENNAVERAAIEAGADIRTRLAAFFASK